MLGCQLSQHGCCQDGRTAAEGPNFDGCVDGSGDMPCDQTRYGCCADGVTAATGLRGQGCEDTIDSEDREVTTTSSRVRPVAPTEEVKVMTGE